MKLSRQLFFHEDVNPGKIRALEALHAEYRRYLQTCIDRMISQRRVKIPRSELTRFFPAEKTLSTNIVAACQQHAASIVEGWFASTYTRKVRANISDLSRGGSIDETQRKALYTIGKYGVDQPSDSVSSEMIEQYWGLLSECSKPPVASDRIGMRLSVHTGTLKLIEKGLSAWWLGVSSLVKRQTIKIPLKANPFVSDPEEIVDGMLVRKDRLGRWVLQTLEKKYAEEPRLDSRAPKVGVDVGLNVMAATSDGRLYGQQIKHRFTRLYDRVLNLRKNRQRQGFRENSRRLDVLEQRLSGLVKTAAGEAANRLIQDYPLHTFVVENLDLSGCRGQRRFAYRAVQQSLERKASTINVNPAYTSQMCPSCLYVHRGNRSGIRFKCRVCGRISHADVVGGINLLGRSEDKQVGLADHPSTVKKILRERYLRKRNSSVGSSSAPPWVGPELTVKGSSSEDVRTAPNTSKAI